MPPTPEEGPLADDERDLETKDSNDPNDRTRLLPEKKVSKEDLKP